MAWLPETRTLTRSSSGESYIYEIYVGYTLTSYSHLYRTRIAPSLEADRSNVTVEGYVPFYSHETERYIKVSPNPICVEYRVGTDRNLTSVVTKGTAYTTSDIDFTVKVSCTLSI
jgi:hypothetical protein